MNNEYYKLYQQDNIALARSLVVKSSDVAEAINTGLLEANQESHFDDPTQWKYYLNLNGEYHSSDAVMTVRSVDTREDIVFSKATLLTHRATARVYRSGSESYQELCRRFPEQLDLIRGILAPVPFDKAYNAADGTILYYDKALVDEQETSLIPQLEQRIKTNMMRWHNPQYQMLDDLYLSGYIGNLFLFVVLTLNALRMNACKTPEAHSFHIREYLASNGRLDKYIPYLNTKQKLFLYRNIRYINRHIGSQEIFDLLVQNILTERNIPLAEYWLQQNISEMPDALYPTVEMRRDPINFGYNQTGVNVFSVHKILDKEAPLARNNPRVQPDAEVSIPQRVRIDQFSSLPTKVLESEAVDRSGSGIKSLAAVLMNEWIYLATHDRYTAYVEIPNTSAGTTMTLTVLDSFILLWYVWWKARDVVHVNVPEVIAYEVLRTPLPTFDELRKVADKRLVSDRLITGMMDLVTPHGVYTSTEAFYDACLDFQKDHTDLWTAYSFQEHYVGRVQAEQVARTHYMNKRCALTATPTTYADWFASNGFNLDTLDKGELDELANNIFQYATGSNLRKRLTFAEIQEAMLSLMKQLSAYSVQYLKTTAYSNFTLVGFPTIRLGDLSGGYKEAMQINAPAAQLQNFSARHKQTLHISDQYVLPPMSFSGKEWATWYMDVQIPVDVKQRNRGTAHINISEVGVQRFEVNVLEKAPPEDGVIPHYQYSTDPLWPKIIDGQPTPADPTYPHTTLVVGTLARGFYGEVDHTDFITGRELCEALDMYAGEMAVDALTWLKFAYNGRALYFPKQPLRHGVSFTDLEAANLVDGSRRIEIGGQWFKIRLLKLYPTANPQVTVYNGTPVTWSLNDGDFNKGAHTGCEYTDLVLPLLSNSGLPNTPWARYTGDAMYLAAYNSAVTDNPATARPFIGQDVIALKQTFATPGITIDSQACALGWRINDGFRTQHETFFSYVAGKDDHQSGAAFTWRPVLELITTPQD